MAPVHIAHRDVSLHRRIWPLPGYGAHRRSRTVKIERVVRALALHHRNVHASDFALGADLNGLFVAGGRQRQVGGKSRSLDEYLDASTARGALEIAEYVAAGFAPIPGNP